MTSDSELMSIAARAAIRGIGRVEPNPLVGCVISSADGRLLGVGHHAVYGGAHAEIEAIANARLRGHDIRGATMHVTLEPCAHTGKTPPCARAIIDAGIARVVIAREDTNDVASGGAGVLREAGVEVVVREERDLGWWAGEPFAHRIRTGLPWTVAKWAQTLDGAVATRTGDSKWISSAASRRHVHRVRGRVDAILTGIGTVLADDPLLTVRDVRARRVPVRAVIDPELKIPLDAKLVGTASSVPTVVFADEELVQRGGDAQGALSRAGVTVVGMPVEEAGISVQGVLRELASSHGASSVMIESGPGLLSRAFRERAVNEALVFVAPKLMCDHKAVRAVSGAEVEMISDATRMSFWRVGRLGGDAVMRSIVER